MSNLLHMAVALRPSDGALRGGAVPDLEPAEAAPPGPVYSATAERILRAALGLFGRRGVKRLGMQEVSEAAGVSRGTLYRYFPSKGHLLDGVAGYDESRFTVGLAAALAPVHQPAERIRALVTFAFDYIRLHPARSLFASEPEFVLGYLFAHLPKLRAALLSQLGDAFDSVPAVASGDLSRGQLADVIVRLFVSSLIMPEPDDRALVQSINAMLLAPPA
jgi:AcrR family transcriptional regulator